MHEEIVAEAQRKMETSLNSVREELARIRTGKATTALLDTVKVTAYGSTVPLKQVAGISVPEPRLILVQPWDPSIVGEIEKALLKSDLGVTPSSDGKVIRLPIPPLTEERRKDLVRLVKKLAEEGRIAIRNVRREANDQLKAFERDGKVSEDAMHRAQKEVQDATDDYVQKVDELLESKEHEIMEV
jgi:ribosome recycling factor